MSYTLVPDCLCLACGARHHVALPDSTVDDLFHFNCAECQERVYVKLPSEEPQQSQQIPEGYLMGRPWGQITP